MKGCMVLLSIALVLQAPGSFADDHYNSSTSPHPDTAICMALGDTDCGGLCTFCHSEPAPSESFFSELHRQGDVEICNRCHEGQTVLGNADFLIGPSGGNHPSQIIFDAAAKPGYRIPENAILYCGKDDPENPSLPWTCKILCSTCHDVHSGSPSMLTVNNSNSELCQDCHDK